MDDQIAVGILSAGSLLVGTVAGGVIQGVLQHRQNRIDRLRSATERRRALYSDYLGLIYDFDRVVDRMVRRPDTERLSAEDEFVERGLPLRVGLTLHGDAGVCSAIDAWWSARKAYLSEFMERSEPIYELPSDERGPGLDALRTELTAKHLSPAVAAVEAAMRETLHE